MPRLSLCLIARDEGDVVSRCLESARPYVDEIVLVDTGSSDDTRARAKASGARIVTRTWTDDFSAARNASLAEATGDWILVLDADEWIEGGVTPAELRRRLETSEAEALSVEMHDRVDGGGLRRYSLVRLFRNRPEHRYQGEIHEQITPSIARRLGVRALDPEAAGLEIGHDGYLRARRSIKGKAQRNLDLLRRRVLAADGDASARYFLARERCPVVLGRAVPGSHLDEALVHLDWLYDHPGILAPRLAADALRLRVSALLAQGRVEEARAALADPLATGVVFELLRIDADLGDGNAEAALERARACFDRDDGGASPFDEHALSGPVVRARAAEAALRLGDVEAAARFAEEGVCLPGGGACAWVAKGAVERARGKTLEAMKAYLEGLRADPSDLWAWAAFAELVLTMGDFRTAADAFGKAAALAPGWDAVDEGLAAAFLAEERYTDLERAFEGRAEAPGEGARAALALAAAARGAVSLLHDRQVPVLAVQRILKRLGNVGRVGVVQRLAVGLRGP